MRRGEQKYSSFLLSGIYSRNACPSREDPWPAHGGGRASGAVRMTDSEIHSPAFQRAQLRSECVRVQALLAVFGFLLALVVLRGIASLSQGHRGEAWPFAVLLALMTANEVGWLRFVKKAIATGREILTATWTAGVFIESLLPTIVIFLLLHSTFIGPSRALTSPAVLVYLLFILLSTLHLNPGLSRWAGVFSAAG